MPLIKVTAPLGALDTESRDQLMSKLSTAVIRAEGADVNDPSARALVWAYYKESSDGAAYVGGQSAEVAPLCIEISTPEGALNDAARKSLVAEVGLIVDDIIGPFEGRLNHWALLREIDEGSWGGGGQVFGLDAIKEAMNIVS